MDSNATWHLVQCKAKQGFIGEQYLHEQGFECYHSVLWQAGRLQSLFPFYLFIQQHAQLGLAKVRSTRGVLRLVEFGGKPTAVSEQWLAALKQQCHSLQHPKAEPELRPGTRVTIEQGALKSMQAIVQCSKVNERVVLLLTLLNRQAQVGTATPSIKLVALNGSSPQY